MSTRCQIGLYQEKEKDIHNFEALIYRHNDGYPSGVLPDILPFLIWWNGYRGISDLEYCGARLLQYLCNQDDDHTLKYINEKFTGIFGHGISKNFHGDLEYIYKIEPSKLTVYKITNIKEYYQWDYKKSEIDMNKFITPMAEFEFTPEGIVKGMDQLIKITKNYYKKEDEWDDEMAKEWKETKQNVINTTQSVLYNKSQSN